MRKIFIVFTIVSLISIDLIAGWSYRVHLNYLKEAASISDYFDYQFYLSYKYDLEKGFIEGEIQYKYRSKGKVPKWMGEISNDEIKCLQGHDLCQDDVELASEFFYERLYMLKQSIIEMERPYSEIMFELGYYLHSINNILLPIYEGVNYPEQPLAANTEKLELDNSKIDDIIDFKSYLKKSIEAKIKMRDTWSEYANNKDREGFIKYADEANKMNIYTIASILRWIASDCFGPENVDTRNHLEAMHESRAKKENGRKLW